MSEKQAPSQSNKELEDIQANLPGGVETLLEKALRHKTRIAMVVVGIIVVAAAFSGYRWYSDRSMKAAHASLGEVALMTAGPEKIQRLEQLVAEVPGSMEPAVYLELATACSEAKQYGKAAEYWGRVGSIAEGPLTVVAAIGQAGAMTADGKGAEALALLKGVEPVPAQLTQAYQRQLAQTALSAGEKDEALSAYKALAEKAGQDRQIIETIIAKLEKNQ